MIDPHYESPEVTLWHGGCLDVLRTLPASSVDAVVTDPPYGLEFMGKQWDAPWKEQGQCATQTKPAPTTTATGAPAATTAPNGTAKPAAAVDANGATRKTDPARAASATIVQADAIGGFQDGNGGNAYSRSRVRTDTRRHGGDMLTANAGFQAWCEQWATECLRVLKPGGHMLAFGGTRTWHRLACAVEDAGFEIRDSIAWMYGSGFPKSLDVSKAIDKAAGAEREVVGRYVPPNGKAWNLEADESVPGYSGGLGLRSESLSITAPATDAARTWLGWGTALKPAFEPVVVARKPLVGTVAGNVLAHGTGALNVDGCRVEGDVPQVTQGLSRDPSSWEPRTERRLSNPHASGRWPANVVLDEDQAAALDEQSGEGQSRVGKPRAADSGDGWGMTATGAEYDDLGGASRFFYVAKADSSERVRVNGVAHPTVKPLSLMRWLVRLVTPPGGTVLEPFAGSGTTVEACLLEGFRCIAIEKGAEYLPLIEARIHRRRDPVAAHRLSGDDEDNLFDLLEES